MKRRIIRVRFTVDGRSYAYRATRKCSKGERVRVDHREYGPILRVIGFGRLFYFGHLAPAWPVKDDS